MSVCTRGDHLTLLNAFHAFKGQVQACAPPIPYHALLMGEPLV